MNRERIVELARRFLLWAAFALLAVSVLEKIANLTGQTMIRAAFNPSELAWYGAMLAVFAIALLLAEVRRELRNR